MDEHKRLASTIVAWNHMSYIPNLLRSLAKQDAGDFSVTIVDNASSDGVVAWVQEHYPDVTVLRNFRNQGFSRGHNQAITLALSHWPAETLHQRYVMVTNPDLEFPPEAVRQLMEYMDAHPDVAACGPKLLRATKQKTNNEEEQSETIRTNIIDSMGLIITKARRVMERGAGEEDRGQYDNETDVFGLSGACVVFRASALQAAKNLGEFFDEDIFAYQEDVDLAWRMRRLGLIARTVPHIVVWHHRRVPSVPSAGWWRLWRLRRRKSPFVNYLSTRNHGWVLLKNDEWGNMFLHAIWWLPYELAKWMAGFTSWSQLKGEAASFVGIPRMLKKRRDLAPRITVRGKEIRKWFI